MNPVSIVIITLNEENNIASCIRSAQLVSDDIIIVDSGSLDNTVNIANQLGARTFHIEWQGFGFARNVGAGLAKNDWILAMDADERITPYLADCIRRLEFEKPTDQYKFKRENYLGNQKIRFGTLGFETVTRIYNRNFSEWDHTLVHEKLVSNHPRKKMISGHMIHYGLKNVGDYTDKAVLYAQMSAEKYFLEGRKAGWLKRIFSPLFNSVKSYFFQLGFLEGRMGFTIAKTIAWYSWLKYFYLDQLNREAEKKEPDFTTNRKIETAPNQVFF